MELVGVTLVTLLLKLTLNFQLSRGNSSVAGLLALNTVMLGLTLRK
jgi:hypothetical protein